MGCLYVVRCNFADPASRAAWEHWYSTEKQDWLLSRPGFRAGQRFTAVRCTDGVEFLALYALDSPAALETPEYRSGWGWGPWRPSIVDWSRNLLDHVDPAVFLTGDDELLRVVFADLSGDAAAEAYPELFWIHGGTGLDGSFRAMGLARTAEDFHPAAAHAAGVAEGLFRPASPARYGGDSGSFPRPVSDQDDEKR